MTATFIAAFVGTAIEGIEIALIVTAAGATRPVAALVGALAALLTIAVLAVVSHQFLAQLDHSIYMKLGVGAVLILFGIHFIAEAVA